MASQYTLLPVEHCRSELRRRAVAAGFANVGAYLRRTKDFLAAWKRLTSSSAHDLECVARMTMPHVTSELTVTYYTRNSFEAASAPYIHVPKAKRLVQEEIGRINALWDTDTPGPVKLKTELFTSRSAFDHSYTFPL